MKLYKRSDFIKLPEGTIYSKPGYNELCIGLFCKTSGEDYGPDFVVQDLISEDGFPDDIQDGMEAHLHQMNLRDTFQEFQTDLDCAGRDGMYDETDTFVVWDQTDIQKLHDYLGKSIELTK
jgi:hypothetical protein